VGTSVAALGSPSTYTVQWGDWLNKIAHRYGLTYQALLAANPGLNPNRIYPGQVISIPSGAGTSPETGPTGGATTYTVQRGDWLYAIARKFGVSVAALQAANPSVTSNVVYPGQVLNIPARGTGAPPPNPKNLVRYTVQYGDTLFSIAVRFHTTTYALQIANHLANSNFIYPGQVLTIP
jgi:LysM repeat protein